MSDSVKIELPFGGFYESIHDSNIDDAIEGGFNYDYDLQDEKEITEEVSDSIFMADVDWQSIRIEYCEAYTNAFADKYGLTLTFDEMTSPREYNFATDRIFCQVPRTQIDDIRKSVEKHKDWQQYIKDNFTSYDGFWSNYENDNTHDDWTRETLDECQYSVVLKFWLDNISDETGSEGWNMDEYYLTNDFEMCGWGSVIEAHETIEAYLIETSNFARCETCGILLNLDNDEGKVVNDYTYCHGCANKNQTELIKEVENA